MPVAATSSLSAVTASSVFGWWRLLLSCNGFGFLFSDFLCSVGMGSGEGALPLPQRFGVKSVCRQERRQGRPKGARVVHGGSFNNNRRNARCACRNNNEPDNRNNNIGFRVVASHSLHFLIRFQGCTPCIHRGQKCSTFTDVSRGQTGEKRGRALAPPSPRPSPHGRGGNGKPNIKKPSPFQ